MTRKLPQFAVTDAIEGPEYVRVSVPGGPHKLVEADDRQGIREAMDELAGEYGKDDTA